MIIHGVNSKFITRISPFRFRRVGKHPLFYKLLYRKSKLLYFLHYFYGMSYYDDFTPARVYVDLAGGWTEVITCRSHEHALQVKKELEEAVNNDKS